MVSKLATYISDLLFEHDAVIVPGFGGFVTSYKPSSIDHVQGLIYAPSKSITFNDNLVVNDGILINYVRNQLNLSAQDARKMVENFVIDIKNSIVKREIVVFPNVGRLYLDYENKIQFLPDNTNYNTDVYGLPTVQYYPILRTRESSSDEAPIPTVASNINTGHYEVEKAKRTRKWASFSSLVPYLIAGAVILCGFGFYQKIITDGSDHLADMVSQHHNNQHYNSSPVVSDVRKVKQDEDVNDVLNDEAVAAEIQSELAEERKVNKETPKIEKVDTEGATHAPYQKEAVIIVHAFGNLDNVQKMIETLSELGYSPYTDKPRSLTRVGIQFIYSSENDIQKRLKRLQKTVSKSAYVLDRK